MLATLILLMTCCEPGKWDSRTRIAVRRILHTIHISRAAGLTSVAMLGNIGVWSVLFSKLEMATSVKMNWLTKCGMDWSDAGEADESNHTPVSIPSPSNQCAERPRSVLVMGLPPLRTYMPPWSSSGILPEYWTGTGDVVFVTGAKLPARYLLRVSCICVCTWTCGGLRVHRLWLLPTILLRHDRLLAFAAHKSYKVYTSNLRAARW